MGSAAPAPDRQRDRVVTGASDRSEMREVVGAAAADAGAVVGGRVSELFVRLLGEGHLDRLLSDSDTSTPDVRRPVGSDERR